MPRKLSARDIKGLATSHPYSRKAAQHARCSLRSSKLAKGAADKTAERTFIIDKMVWFRWAVDEDLTHVSKDQVRELVEMYLSRHDEEIDTLIASQIKGRPKAKRLDLLEAWRAKEHREYETGVFELPDLMNGKNLKVLRAWNADFGSISTIKIMRIKKASPGPPPPAGDPKPDPDVAMTEAP